MILIIDDSDRQFINKCIAALTYDQPFRYKFKRYHVDRVHIHSENKQTTFTITLTPVRIKPQRST